MRNVALCESTPKAAIHIIGIPKKAMQGPSSDSYEDDRTVGTLQRWLPMWTGYRFKCRAGCADKELKFHIPLDPKPYLNHIYYSFQAPAKHQNRKEI